MVPLECPIPITDYDAVTLAHGGGGKLSARLIEELFLPALDSPLLRTLHDGALLPEVHGRLALSTDTFVVHPPFFPGGDIGLLAVHGTTNDLAMCGARPRYLSLALILEEGFLLKDLWRLLLSIREATEALGIEVVTGDTKVVERGKGDGIFINTTGLGERVEGSRIEPRRVRAGDKILLNGPLAEHGMAIMSVREDLGFEGDLRSDTAALWPLVERLLEVGGRSIHALRDATRGGIASVTNEIARAADVGISLEEAAVPVREPVRAACEILGFDPLYVANEGRFLTFVEAGKAEALLEVMREHPLGQGATLLGEVVEQHPGRVTLRSVYGGTRVLDMMSGEQLPRIC